MVAEHALRRALARADAGKTLDADEATALLAARGEALARAHGIAARMRDAALRRAHHLQPQGLHPADAPVPRQLRLLHVRVAAQGRRARVPVTGAGLDIARAGAAAGCKEALFTLGDRPEDRYPAAASGSRPAATRTTLEYLRAVADAVIEETGLLPHLNPGVLSWTEMATLKHVSGSMGLMLESTSPPARARVCRTSTRPTRIPRCDCARWRTPAGCRSPSPPGC